MKGSADSRGALLRQSLIVEAVLIGWNVLEGVIAISAGILASSVALVTFGIDSAIEVASAAVVLRRLWFEFRGASDERVARVERGAAKIAGSLLLALAVYVLVDAGRRLAGSGPEAAASLAGILLTSASIVVMPILGGIKFRLARQLGSAALRADSVQTLACVWLSLATWGGLALNAAFGWSWADPIAALLLLPMIIHEGIEGLRGE